MMVKATRRCAVLLGFVAAGMVVGSVPSFAEVQNVKVSGDVTARGFYRRNLDLHDEGSSNTASFDTDHFFMSTIGLNVAADLTENVSAMLRLTNERDWNLTSTSSSSEDIALSQGYVTVKELFYSPLTLRVGRQPIVWGRGFVLGSNLFPGVNGRGDDLHAAISANEFTDFTAFDAVRATLDLSGVAGLGTPLSLDYVYIKSDENSVADNDDVNLQGANLGARFESWNSEMETYFLNKRDSSSGTSKNDNDGSISTLGVRGSVQPVEGASVWGELAYQFGDEVTDPAGVLPAGKSHQAWAANLAAEYTFAEIPTTPKVGVEWRYYSGKDLDGATAGWATIAPGYFTTVLREFQTPRSVAGFYPNDQTFFSRLSGPTGAGTASGTNQNEFAVYGSLKPIEDLTIAPRLSWFFLPVGAFPLGPPSFGEPSGSGQRTDKRKHYAGMEWDTIVTYDYTDDVQFGFIYALFAPGNVYRSPNDATAQEMISSVSVKF